MNKYDWSDMWVFVGLVGLAMGIGRAFEGYPLIELVYLGPVVWLVWRLWQLYTPDEWQRYNDPLWEEVCTDCGHTRREHPVGEPGCLKCEKDHWFSRFGDSQRP